MYIYHAYISTLFVVDEVENKFSGYIEFISVI